MRASSRLFGTASFILALASVGSLGACGGNSSSATDAPTISLTDAPPPDAGPPDAFVCSLPSMMCGADCIDVSTDEMHCGDCTTVCQTGASCISNSCTCPSQFLPRPRPAPS